MAHKQPAIASPRFPSFFLTLTALLPIYLTLEETWINPFLSSVFSALSPLLDSCGSQTSSLSSYSCLSSAGVAIASSGLPSSCRLLCAGRPQLSSLLSAKSSPLTLSTGQWRCSRASGFRSMRLSTSGRYGSQSYTVRSRSLKCSSLRSGHGWSATSSLSPCRRSPCRKSACRHGRTRSALELCRHAYFCWASWSSAAYTTCAARAGRWPTRWWRTPSGLRVESPRYVHCL